MEIAKARWPSRRARERAGDRRSSGKPRLDRPPLLVRRERIGKLSECRPRAHGGHQIRGLIFDDATQPGDIESDVVTRRRIADRETRPAATDDDRLAAIVRTADRVGDVGLARGAHDPAGGHAVQHMRIELDGYTHIPSASARLVRSVGMSAQASPPGNTLPGFILESGSKASRARRCASRSSGPKTQNMK